MAETLPNRVREGWRRFVAFCKTRRGDFLYDLILIAILAASGWLLTWFVWLAALPSVSTWLVPIIAFIVAAGIVVFPIVRELRRPQAAVYLQSGAQVGRMVFPVDPAKAAKGKYFESQSVNILSLMESGVVRGKTCKDCDVYGPAVLVLDQKSKVGGDFEHAQGTTFEIVAQSPLLPFPPGIVPMIDCTFDSCRFHNIGFITNASNLTGATKPPPQTGIS